VLHIKTLLDYLGWVINPSVSYVVNLKKYLQKNLFVLQYEYGGRRKQYSMNIVLLVAILVETPTNICCLVVD